MGGERGGQAQRGRSAVGHARAESSDVVPVTLREHLKPKFNPKNKKAFREMFLDTLELSRRIYACNSREHDK